MMVSKVRLTVAMASVAAAFVLAACGSGEEVTAIQPSPAPTATVQPTAATPLPSAPTAQPVDETQPPAPEAPTSEPTQVDAESFRPGEEAGTAGSGLYFRSPSGNVACGILDPMAGESLAGCQAVSSVPSSAGTVCKNFGNSLYLNTIGAEGAVSRCTSQGVFFTDPPSTVLQYGQVISSRGISCESTTAGIECTQGSSGFVMSRDRNVIR